MTATKPSEEKTAESSAESRELGKNLEKPRPPKTSQRPASQKTLVAAELGCSLVGISLSPWSGAGRGALLMHRRRRSEIRYEPTGRRWPGPRQKLRYSRA